MNKQNIIGFIGTGLIQSASLSQTVKMILTGSAEGVPLEMFLLIVIGMVFFNIHSFMLKDKVYIISNGIGLLNCLVVLLTIFITR